MSVACVRNWKRLDLPSQFVLEISSELCRTAVESQDLPHYPMLLSSLYNTESTNFFFLNNCVLFHRHLYNMTFRMTLTQEYSFPFIIDTSSTLINIFNLWNILNLWNGETSNRQETQYLEISKGGDLYFIHSCIAATVRNIIYI